MGLNCTKLGANVSYVNIEVKFNYLHWPYGSAILSKHCSKAAGNCFCRHIGMADQILLASGTHACIDTLT